MTKKAEKKNRRMYVCQCERCVTNLLDCDTVCDPWWRALHRGLPLEVCFTDLICIRLNLCCLETYWPWLPGYHFNWLKCEAVVGGEKVRSCSPSEHQASAEENPAVCKTIFSLQKHLRYESWGGFKLRRKKVLTSGERQLRLDTPQTTFIGCHGNKD